MTNEVADKNRPSDDLVDETGVEDQTLTPIEGLVRPSRPRVEPTRLSQLIDEVICEQQWNRVLRLGTRRHA